MSQLRTGQIWGVPSQDYRYYVLDQNLDTGKFNVAVVHKDQLIDHQMMDPDGSDMPGQQLSHYSTKDVLLCSLLRDLAVMPSSVDAAVARQKMNDERRYQSLGAVVDEFAHYHGLTTAQQNDLRQQLRNYGIQTRNWMQW